MKYNTKRVKAKKLRIKLAILLGFILAGSVVIFSQGWLLEKELSFKQFVPTKPITLTKLGNSVIREITAYNSLSEQTDSTPCISADGSDICKRFAKGENICATNAYPLGTKLFIDKFGYCTVADRMNKRFANRVDVFLHQDKHRALAFGLQRLEVSTIIKQDLIN